MQIEKQKSEYVKDSFSEYLGKITHVSASDLKNFLKSPKFFYYKKYHEKPANDEEKRHFLLGSAMHELILEPEKFKNNYAVSEKFDRRTSEGRLKSSQFEIDNHGKGIIFTDEFKMITEMASSVRNNDVFMKIIADSYRELSIYTIDSVTGLNIKLRPDVFSKNRPTIIDLKSCLDSSLKGFKKDVYSYGYAITASFYSDFSGKDNYLFCAIEKSVPYQTSLFMLSEEIMNYGRVQYRMALHLMKWSYDNNYWCDYGEFELLKKAYETGDLSSFSVNELKSNNKITVIN